VSVREEALELPGSGEILLESIVSAISPGTEMLFYNGQLEEGALVDATLQCFRRELSYPLRYGYASVGRIVKAGDGVDPALVGRLAFAFTPHASASCVPVDLAIPVPDGITAEEAAFLASAETAVNLVLDSRPLLGERASVFGLGVIGLLTAGLLARFPLACLSGWDLHPLRVQAAASLGVTAADPNEKPPGVGTEDFAVEVSGSAAGFRLALSSCGFSGRLVIGSWYGTGTRGQAFDSFDTAFHRNRVRIVPSQVSTIDPSLTGRWSRARRLAEAWEAIRFLRPGRLITHRVPFSRAADAYRLIAGSQGETIQVMLVHESAGNPPLAPG
jgi:2-desacetyl-2-hydroxyethyl bacteriochlorophyllide A dehydrogenase